MSTYFSSYRCCFWVRLFWAFSETHLFFIKENSKGKSSFRHGNTGNLKGNKLVLCEGIQPKDYSKKRKIISKEPDYKKQLLPVFKFVSISKYVWDCCLIPTRF
ncbi:hypothetical protein A7A78_04475 [Aequorivita soesokkakensis]|uniref:Uncharacterized protein n=1 Tax=Aequorivita soesokkakensis TaxID=1385699 RepID=A0A1A9LDP5_9FLAO|nr:hypothetical protein A7A78_04475 [Aequorivita soesokkakensis]